MLDLYCVNIVPSLFFYGSIRIPLPSCSSEAMDFDIKTQAVSLKAGMRTDIFCCPKGP